MTGRSPKHSDGMRPRATSSVTATPRMAPRSPSGCEPWAFADHVVVLGERLSPEDEHLEPCDCGWTPELGTHYRVKLKIPERDKAARATDFA
jgi:hypothetical protein